MSESKVPGSTIQVLENIIIQKESSLNATKQSNPSSSNENTEYRKEIKILNKNAPKKIDFAEDEHHPQLISPAHAVPSSNAEILVSDDDDPKVILTLDTVGASTKDVDFQQNFVEIREIKEEDDISEMAAVIQESCANKHGNAPTSASVEISEIAKMQLQALASQKRGQKNSTIQNLEDEDPLHISETEISLSYLKPPRKNRIYVSSIITKDELEKEVLDRVSVPLQKDISNDARSLDNDANVNVKNEDLIAILEGPGDDIDNMDDEPENIEEYELLTVTENGEPINDISQLTKEDERKLALQQIMSFPKPARGRKRKLLIPKEEPKTETVRSLVSDWSDTEKEAESKAAIENQEKRQIKKKEKENTNTTPMQTTGVVPFRRTRVIKKKIIWDPDAPETQFSYASLVQSSAKKPPKKVVKINTPTSSPVPAVKKSEVKMVRVKSNEVVSTAEPKVKIINTLKRRSETPPNLLNKKKKFSEVDRLLRDEGAANMIHEIENEIAKQTDSAAKKDGPSADKNQIKRDLVPKRRIGRSPQSQSASSSWDYVYNQRNVDSLIIRRRSNSSYSSTSPRRLSLDHTPNQPGGRQTTGIRGKAFEFAKPDMKKVNKNIGSSSTGSSPAETSKSDIREVTRRSNRSGNTHVEIPTKTVATEQRSQQTQNRVGDVSVKRHGDVVQLILKPKVEKVKNTFSPQLMKDVVHQLNILQKDNSCKVVLITSSGQHFCQGVDFFSIAQGSLERRKTTAQEVATCVKNFLNALAAFPKPLIAGITGACSGLGVTMLPLFDIVVASDKCTFETPYAKIGQLPEGYCVLSLTNNIRHNFKTKLIFLCEKLNSTEAALAGLVTKIEIPSKVMDETLQCAKKIASLSQQTFSAIKTQRQKAELDKLNSALSEEQNLLVQHWTSSECLEKFKHFLTNDHW